MKRLIPLLLATLLFLSSCATDGSVSPTVQVLLPSVVSVAASSVIEQADSSDDRQAKALILRKVADHLLLVVDENTTGDDIVRAIQEVTPQRQHWLILSATLGGLFDQYRIKPNASVTSLTNALAAGLKNTAAYYINEP